MMWLVLSAGCGAGAGGVRRRTWKLIWNSSRGMLFPGLRGGVPGHFDRGTLGRWFSRLKDDRATPLLVVARKGRGTWRVTVNGRGAHAGGEHPHGADAIVELGRTLQRVAALTDYPRGLTVNVATIRGGTVLNRVPHEASAEGEDRGVRARGL